MSISFCILYPCFSLKQGFWVAEIVSVSPGREDPLILWSAFADICGMFKMHSLGAYRACVIHFSEDLYAFQALKESEALQTLIMTLAGAPVEVFVLDLAS